MNPSPQYGRRGSVSHASVHGVPIPNAPPLPILAPRPLQRARDAASRFLGYAPSRPLSAHGDRDDERFAQGSAQFKRQPSLGISQDATASHRTGLEINTIAANETGTHALIGGKGIFKTVKIEDGHCTEDLNLRTTILSTPRNASGAPRDIYQIDIADVAWAKGDHDNYVVAATSSGKIILYNLAVAGLQGAQLHEHSRQVHKVTFNPHMGNLLLSGSQDGTVRLWDLRDVKHQVSTLQSKRKYSGQADGVRDVKWSPTEGVDFAFGTDNGDVQKWDIRNFKAPKVKVSGHLLACNSIDWHPDGKHLVSASSDRSIRVFDLSGSRPKKPSWEIRTPYPVMDARWRPSCESSFPSDNGAKLCAQIITAYDRHHPMLHLWDLRRPYLPFREFAPYNSAPTDFMWHSQDLLWTVGREGIFLQTDLQHVPKVIARRNLQAVAVSPEHELLHIAQTRDARRVLNPRKPVLTPRAGTSLSVSPETNFLSRSWADDSIDQLYLGVSPTLRSKKSSEYGSRVQHTASRSYAYFERTLAPTIKLDEMLLNRKTFRPNQVALYGPLPLRNGPSAVPFAFMREVLHLSCTSSLDECTRQVSKVMDGYIDAAAAVGLLRLSQTWKILQFSLVNHLKERAERKRQLEQEDAGGPQSRSPRRLSVAKLAARFAMQYLKSPTQSPRSMRPVSTIVHHLAMPESSSNVPTPLARPATAKPSHLASLPDPSEDDITLPPSLAHGRPAFAERPDLDRDQAKSPEQRLTADNLTDLESRQVQPNASERIEMVRRWSVQPRVPLNFDAELRQQSEMPRYQRHDSDESFRFLEGSVDSQSVPNGESFSSVASRAQLVAERPSRRTGPTEPPRDPKPTIALSQPMPFEGSGTLANSTNLDRSEIRNGSFDSMTGTPENWSPDNPVPKGLPYEREETDGIGSNLPDRPDDVDGDDAPFTHKEHSRPPSPSERSTRVPDASSDHDVESTARNHTRPATSRAPDLFSNISFGGGDHYSSPDRAVEHIDLEEDKPWTLIDMLNQLVRFYTVEEPHPQALSMLMLLVGRLLPLTHPIPEEDMLRSIRVLLEHSVDHLGVEIDDVHRWFSACDYEQLLHAGLQPLQVENILSTYHEKMLSRRAFTESAELRKLSYPAFPAVYEDFLKDITVNFKCGNCGKPINTSLSSRTRCERCRLHANITRRRSCNVCWMPHSPWTSSPHSGGMMQQYGSPAVDMNRDHHNHHHPQSIQAVQAKLRTACLACGHGGHAACYHHWFVTSAGVGCPTEGCLCPCVPVAI